MITLPVVKQTIPSFTRPYAELFAKMYLGGNIDACIELAEHCEGTPWRRNLLKLCDFASNLYRGYMAKPPFKIFCLHGNKKLPFATFSTLPVITCPGAGECAGFCYSFKAWRYPAAFCRQLQNTLLLRRFSTYISDTFYALPRDITLRLYVDGDIENTTQLRFWCERLLQRPDIGAYGYSKSWAVFLEYHDSGNQIPSNYVLNISSGSNGSTEQRERMLSMPFVRGEFIAVHKRANPRAYLMSNGHRKAMTCPLLCGSCTKIGHACGNMAFKGVSVGINVH